MSKIAIAAVMFALIGAPAFAAGLQQPAPASSLASAKGKMLVTAAGERLAPVYEIDSNGPQIIFEGRMVTVPANTISMASGKPVTSLTKREVIDLP